MISLKPSPSCFDNKQNQNEEGLDCGGVCQPCELKEVADIRLLPVRLIEALNGKTSALLEFQNPNLNYGASPFYFDLNFLDKSGKVIKTISSQTVLAPAEIAFRVEPNLDADFDKISRAEIIAGNYQWLSRAQMPAVKIQARDVSIILEKEGRGRIKAFIKNESSITANSVYVHAIVFNDLASVAGLSRTLIENLRSQEERSVEIIVPLIDFGSSANELDVRLTFEVRQ